MRLLIHATNVHQGGGRTLLIDLLGALSVPSTAFLDTRLDDLPALDPQVRVVRVEPTLTGRLQAERALRKLSQSGDVVLCLGNLPPLFPNPARVFVYLQNRYLSGKRSLRGLPWRVQGRLLLERLWLRFFIRNATLLVQTETMAQDVREHLHRDSRIWPFFPRIPLTGVVSEKLHDFVYVASGEPHKNHRRLIEAWKILSLRGYRPSLCLTLDERRDIDLLAWVEGQAKRHKLRVVNRPVAFRQVGSLYEQARALIYPSLFESFGLPLLEARAYQLPLIAAERDYVRDIVQPDVSFDPESPLSIARAVMRHLDPLPSVSSVADAREFLQQLMSMR